LCQINAALGVLHTRAHVPEHCVDEGNHYQEAQDQAPDEVEKVGYPHKNGARNPTAHSRSPGPVHLISCGTGGQKSDE